MPVNAKKPNLEMPVDSNLSTPKNGNVKNYGKVSEQIFKQQQSRRETLDKLLLQMQIEKEKVSQYLNCFRL